jgi:hypothetical protein
LHKDYKEGTNGQWGIEKEEEGGRRLGIKISYVWIYEEDGGIRCRIFNLADFDIFRSPLTESENQKTT